MQTIAMSQMPPLPPISSPPPSTGGASTTIPAVCYAICNASLLEFQKTGLVPSVCADDGSFQQNAADCYACASQGNGGNGFSSAFANEPHGAAFIAVFRYCAGIKPTVLPVTVLMTTTIGSVQQVFSITTNITMGTPTQTTMASTTSSLLEPPTPVTTSTPPSSQPTPDSGRPSTATIAGGAVGGVVGLVLLSLLLFLFNQRRRHQ
ncbi:cell wall integrity and stress response component [Microdochium nivale]|nr:cell wall integrity and stress response component [Microdochium nivale]